MIFVQRLFTASESSFFLGKLRFGCNLDKKKCMRIAPGFLYRLEYLNLNVIGNFKFRKINRTLISSKDEVVMYGENAQSV